jgi:hypothetical protein
VWLTSKAFQRGGKPRFADTRFSREQHDLAFTALGYPPPPQQQFDFFFPPDQSS